MDVAIFLLGGIMNMEMIILTKKEKLWVVYMLECKDGTMYCGMTDNITSRLAAHRSGKGAKYTRGRSPLILRYVERCSDRSEALRREIAIKRLSRQQKLALWQSNIAAEAELIKRIEID